MHELGDEIYSVTDVIDEIKDRHTRYLIGSLPVTLNMRQPQPESLKLVSDFSKKTGDYPSLSLTDLKVLAVTYDLEVEANDGSSEHLNKDPKMRVVDFGGHTDSKVNGNSDLPIGFYMPSRQKQHIRHANSSDKKENVDFPSERGSYDYSSSVAFLSNEEDTVGCGISHMGHKDQFTLKSSHIQALNNHLKDYSYVGGHSLTSDDFDVYAAILEMEPRIMSLAHDLDMICFSEDSCDIGDRREESNGKLPLCDTTDNSLPCNLYQYHGMVYLLRWISHISSFDECCTAAFGANEAARSIFTSLGDKYATLGKPNSHVVGTVQEKEETLSVAETRGPVKSLEGHENEEICTEEVSLTEEYCNIKSSEAAVLYNSQQGLEETQDLTHEDAGSVDLKDEDDDEGSWTMVSRGSKQNRNRRQCWEHTEEYLASTSALDSVTGSEVVLDLSCGEESDDEQEAVDDSCDDDDEEGWITKEDLTLHDALKEGIVKVACITADFAMQNVLKQLGIPVMGVNGRMIGDIRTFILRCHACFKTTSVMTSAFCPKCGNKTLKRVSVTINPDGTQRIWINTKRPINTRGMKYSLPTPQGGKHAVNPLLVVDQREARQFPSNLTKKKFNPMDVDYIAGQSAFATRDVYSRASKLGYIGGKHHCGRFYWEQRNPNVPKKNAKKRK